MKTKAMFHTSRTSSRGSTLVVSLVLVFVAVTTVAAVTSHTISVHKLNDRTIAREKATMVAEAGLHRLKTYLAQPSRIPDNMGRVKTMLTAYKAMEEEYVDEEQGRHSLTPAYITSSDRVFVSSSRNLNTDLVSRNGASVIDLRITAPVSGLYAPAGTEFTLVSTGEYETQRGELATRTVYMHTALRPETPLTVPAGILSGAGVSGNGHFNLHWGEAWSRGPLHLLYGYKAVKDRPDLWDVTGGNNQVTRDDDKWVSYMTSDYIYDSGSTILKNDASVQDVFDYYVDAPDPAFDDMLYQQDPMIDGTLLSTLIDETLAKFNTINDPLTGYEYWKNTAIARDTYYQVREDGVYSASGVKIYDSASDAMEAYRARDDVYVAFFDTTDGNPPVTDGSESNWSDVRFTGAIDTCSRGLLYVAGDMYLGGSGTPPAITVEDPDDVANGVEGTTTLNVFHDGVIWTAGDYTYQGNGVCYGAVLCEGDYDAGGDPAVYYNAALKDGDPQELSDEVQVLATYFEGINVE